jgi:hypothetical protein
VVDAAQLGDQRGGVLAHRVEVLGGDEDGHALALDEAAQGTAHDGDDALGLDGDRALERLLGDLQRELDGGGLGLLGQLVAQARELGGGGLQRERGGLDDRARVGGALGVALGVRLGADAPDVDRRLERSLGDGGRRGPAARAGSSGANSKASTAIRRALPLPRPHRWCRR